jgi:hypothetical protein
MASIVRSALNTGLLRATSLVTTDDLLGLNATVSSLTIGSSMSCVFAYADYVSVTDTINSTYSSFSGSLHSADRLACQVLTLGTLTSDYVSLTKFVVASANGEFGSLSVFNLLDVSSSLTALNAVITTLSSTGTLSTSLFTISEGLSRIASLTQSVTVLNLLSLTSSASLSTSSFNCLPTAAIYSSFTEATNGGLTTGTITLNWYASSADLSTINLGGLIKTNTGLNSTDIVLARSGLFQVSTVLQLTVSNTSATLPTQFSNQYTLNLRTNSTLVTRMSTYRRPGNLISLPANAMIPILADTTLTLDVGYSFAVASTTITCLNGNAPNYKGTQIILKKINDYVTP